MSIPQEEKRMVAIILNADQNGIFNNGLHQNGYFLYRLLQKIPNIQPFLTCPDNLLPEDNRVIENLQQCFGINVIPMSFFKEKYRCDVMIMGSFAIDPKTAAPYKARGTKFVAPVWGHKYVMNHETAVFGRFSPEKGEENGNFRNFSDNSILRRNEGVIDAIWLSPHFTWTKQFIAASYDHPLDKTFTAPYIWDSELVEKSIKDEPLYAQDDKTPFFRPGDPENKKIYSLEPNINIVKSSLVPFYIGEHLYKENSDHFEHLYLFGANILAKNKHFVQLVNHSAFFEDGKTNKISFESRTKIPFVFSRSKVQLAHHWNLGLNYTYLEGAYFHHPVVHNSEFMKDMGYYYRGASVIDASSQLSMALRHEERSDLDEYNAHCDEVVHRFSINNEKNIKGYATLIENLFTGEPPVLPDYIDELESSLAYGGGYFSPSHLPSSYLL